MQLDKNKKKKQMKSSRVAGFKEINLVWTQKLSALDLSKAQYPKKCLVSLSHLKFQLFTIVYKNHSFMQFNLINRIYKLHTQ
jgi:hypothetical protein